MKFQRKAEPATPRETELKERRMGPEAAMDFGSIMARAFGMTDAAAPLLAGLADDPHWYLSVSYDGAPPAGAGALYVSGDIAWTEWGATEPAFRRRGSQGAIMVERINIAVGLGCRHIFTETGEAAGGGYKTLGFYENLGEVCVSQNALKLTEIASRIMVARGR